MQKETFCYRGGTMFEKLMKKESRWLFLTLVVVAIVIVAAVGFIFWYRGELVVRVNTVHYKEVAVFVDGEWVENIPTNQDAEVGSFSVGKHTLKITASTDHSRVLLKVYNFEIERGEVTRLGFSHSW